MRITVSVLVCACLLLAHVGAVTAAEPVSIDPSKKLIEWGWDEPSPSFMQANQKKMDRMGFDGVIFHAEARKGDSVVNFAWNCWGDRRFEIKEFASDIESLKACEFKHLTSNFLRFNVCPGTVDWFDDKSFEVVTHNARVAALVAKQGGCKGFMFDIEMYNSGLFTYVKQAHAEGKSFEEYEAKVRQRGREFMAAINDGFEDITVLLTFGYGITGVGGDRSKAPYGLLKNFLDGMFEAAGDETTIVDAYEGAYPFRKHGQFESAYRGVRKDMAKYCAVPDKYRKHLQVGFGVWLDMNWRRYGWDRDNLENNYFTPEEFEYSVFAGLDVTDRYVWIYTEVPRWWPRHKLPAAYRRALRKARLPHVIDDSQVVERAVHQTPAPPPKAAAQPGYSDEDTFGDLEAEYEFIADLPKTWKFRTDPKGEGVVSKWAAPGIDLTGWRDIKIGMFWDEQEVKHTGYAWYRIDWTAPRFEAAKGKKVVLWFGAADEAARVWVNGKLVGEHDIGADIGWDKRFPIDVTGAIKPGEMNTIAVRVHNTTLAGGLWKSIKLAMEKPGG